MFVKSSFFILVLVLWSNFLTAQVRVYQDSKFEYLLNEKRKVNASITVTDKFKIQIFYGNGEDARKVLSEFKQNHDNFDVALIFSSPNYKVQVGRFRTKIEAERIHAEILKEYPEALLVRLRD